MAWVTPSNVATGDVLTASKWNQDVVENTEFLFTPPMCVLSTTTNVTMATANIGYAIPFGAGTELADTDSMHDTATNNSRITITTAGVYVLTANAGFQVSNFANSYRALFIRRDGSSVISQHLHAQPSGLNYYFSCSVIVNASAGTYYEAMVQHNDNVSRDTATSVQPLGFSAVWVGKA